jgi:hypothetical protein
LLDGHAAVLARLAGQDADFDNLPLGEQAQRAAGRQHLAPVEMRSGHGMHGALGEALGSRSRAKGIPGLLDQQGLITMQGVKRTQAFLDMGGELGSSKLHGDSKKPNDGAARGAAVP